MRVWMTIIAKTDHLSPWVWEKGFRSHCRLEGASVIVISIPSLRPAAFCVLSFYSPITTRPDLWAFTTHSGKSQSKQRWNSKHVSKSLTVVLVFLRVSLSLSLCYQLPWTRFQLSKHSTRNICWGLLCANNRVEHTEMNRTQRLQSRNTQRTKTACNLMKLFFLGSKFYDLLGWSYSANSHFKVWFWSTFEQSKTNLLDLDDQLCQLCLPSAVRFQTTTQRSNFTKALGQTISITQCSNPDVWVQTHTKRGKLFYRLLVYPCGVVVESFQVRTDNSEDSAQRPQADHARGW